MSERLKGHAPQHRSSVHDVRVPQVGRNCSYTELQTRSADEGTTIFLLSHVLHTVDPGRVDSENALRMRLSRDVESATSVVLTAITAFVAVAPCPEMYP
jgi:hypothetical protein